MPPDDKHIELRPHRHGPVATYQVFVDDFDRIEQEAENVGSDLTVSIFWLTEATAFTLALPTVPKEWIHIFSTFEVAMFAGYGFGLYFLWRWFKQKNSLKVLMDRIRSSQIPEFGESGKELSLSELTSLPAQQAEPMPQSGEPAVSAAVAAEAEKQG